MDSLVIRPERYRQLGSGSGCHFVLATNTGWEDRFTIQEAGSYLSSRIVGFDGAFPQFLASVVPEPAHVLVISPERAFCSPSCKELGRRKLMAMACNTTPTPTSAIAHYLRALEQTAPATQEEVAEGFFDLVDTADVLEIVDDAYGTRALFQHRHQCYSWNQQTGPIDWGGQQVAPSGVITVIPMEVFSFDASRRLEVDGEVTLRGPTIMHSWRDAHLGKEQAEYFQEFSTLTRTAVILTMKDGQITGLRATNPMAEPAVRALTRMFEQDVRYRIIWEFGFALNSDFELFDGNMAMNEIHGGPHGTVRWSIGLLPYTPHAPVFLCPGSRIVGSDGRSIGAPSDPTARRRPRIVRRKVAGCPCHWFATTCDAAKSLERGQAP